MRRVGHTLLSLMKQARAHGVGVLVVTQKPMDLDQRVLSNAGVWFVGRLQTNAALARGAALARVGPFAASANAHPP